MVNHQIGTGTDKEAPRRPGFIMSVIARVLSLVNTRGHLLLGSDASLSLGLSSTDMLH